jgi:ribosomal-protein-alanine N-acetyltransferase
MQQLVTPVLITGRLSLRGLFEPDGPQIMAIRSNAEVNKYLGRSCDVTIDDALSFIKKIQGIVSRGEGFYWGIMLKGHDELIGTICYWNLDVANKKAETGYELHPDWQGKGIMYEALSAVVNYGFENMGLNVITASPVEQNKSSIKLLLKSGFSLVGKFSEYNANFVDYRFTRDSWLTHSQK